MQNEKSVSYKDAAISLHRYCDQIALSVLNVRGTVYISAEEAEKIANGLLVYAGSVKTERFASHSAPDTIKINISDWEG